MLGDVGEYGLCSSLRQYLSSVWNQLDCLSMLLYFFGTPMFNIKPFQDLFQMDAKGFNTIMIIYNNAFSLMFLI